MYVYMYLFSYILFLLFNEFWSCFTGTVFPCFRFPGGGPCLPSAYEKQLTPRIDQWLRVEQTGKLKHPVFFVLQNLFQLAIGMIFYSKLIVSIRWFQFSWFGKWLLHQTSNSILGFFRGSRYSTMRIETVEHDLFWVWDIYLKRTGPEEHGFFWWKKIEEPNGGTRKVFVNKSVLFRIFLGSPGKVPQDSSSFFLFRQETIGFGIYRQNIDEEISEHDAEIVPGHGWWMLFANETPCTQRVPQEKRSEGSILDILRMTPLRNWICLYLQCFK